MNLLSVRQFELVPRTKKIREFVTKRYLSKFYTIVLLIVHVLYKTKETTAQLGPIDRMK